MHSGWTPPLVPKGYDKTVYIVEDDFGKLGRIYRETEANDAGAETIIADLLSGRYNNPIRIVAFNTLENWSQDASRDIAHEIQQLCDIHGQDVPEHIRDFVEMHTGPARQLTLRLVL